MKKQNIHFVNVHSAFDLEIGGQYDFDVSDNSGEVYPVSDVKVLSASEYNIKVEDYEGDVFTILKKFIVFDAKVED